MFENSSMVDSYRNAFDLSVVVLVLASSDIELDTLVVAVAAAAAVVVVDKVTNVED